MGTISEIIEDFLYKFAVKTSKNEDSSTTELYMDDHICIDYEDQTYYIKENNSLYTEEDEKLLNILKIVYE